MTAPTADHAPRSIQSTDGVVAWPDGTEFVNVTNRCCGSPYPIAVLPSGAEHCAGCAHDVAPTVEAERALDEDADMWMDYDDGMDTPPYIAMNGY